MIIAAFEGGMILRFLKVKDSIKIQYTSYCLQQEGFGEV